MKKFLVLIFLFAVSAGCCFGISKDDAKIQITALRRTKQAQVNIINKEIDKKSEIIAEIYSDSTLSDKEKEFKIQEVQKEINQLVIRKTSLNQKYLKDKKAVKKQIGKN